MPGEGHGKDGPTGKVAPAPSLSAAAVAGGLHTCNAAEGVRQSLRRVSVEAGMELVERVVVGRETGKMVTVGRETGKRLTLVASFTRGAASALGDKYVGDFSFSPTTTKVTFEPQLESGRFDDVWVLKDRVRRTPVLGTFVENFLQPVSFVAYYVTALLVPFWGYAAVRDLLAAARGSISMTDAPWSLVVMTLNAVGTTVLLLVMAIDFHPAVVRLIWREAKPRVVLAVGSRLLYTAAAISYFPHVTNVLWLILWVIGVAYYCFNDALLVFHKMRLKPAAYQRLYGHGGIVPRATYAASSFGFMLECARHFALLLAAKNGGATTILELVPSGFLSGSMRVTNVNVMNVTFTAFMVIYAQVQWTHYRSCGEQFAMIKTRINMHRVVPAE